MSSISIHPANRFSWEKWVFGVTLFLLITDGYRLTSFLPVLSVSRFLALTTVLLLLYGAQTLSRCLQRLDVLLLFFATTVAWPVLSAFWAPAPTLRDIAIQIHLFSIFLGSAAFWQRHPNSALAIPLSAILFSAVFAILSLVFPSAFKAFAEEADALYDYRGRAFGLFLQPNSLAHNLCLIYATVLLGSGRWPLKTLALATALLLACVGLSGSRAGMLTAALLVIIVIASELRSANIAFMQKRKSQFLVLMSSILLMMTAVVATGGDRITFGGNQNLKERIASIYDERARKGTRSISSRVALANRYLNAAQQKPLLGHGIGSSYFFVSQRRFFENRSHNGAIEAFYLYGGIGFALWALMLTAFCFTLQWHGVASDSVTKTGLFASLILLAFASNTFIVNRSLCFILGAMYALHLQRMHLFLKK